MVNPFRKGRKDEEDPDPRDPRQRGGDSARAPFQTGGRANPPLRDASNELRRFPSPDSEEKPASGRLGSGWFSRDKGTDAPEPRARPTGAFVPPTAPDRRSSAGQSDKAPDEEKKGRLGFLRRGSKDKEEESGKPLPRTSQPPAPLARDRDTGWSSGLSSRGREEFPSSFASSADRSRPVPGTGPLGSRDRPDDLTRRPGERERGAPLSPSPFSSRDRDEPPASRPFGSTERPGTFGSGSPFSSRDRDEPPASRPFGSTERPGTFGSGSPFSSRDRDEPPALRPFGSTERPGTPGSGSPFGSRDRDEPSQPLRSSPFGSREQSPPLGGAARQDRLGQTARPPTSRPVVEPPAKPEPERKSRLPLLGRSKGAQEDKKEDKKSPSKSKGEAAPDARFVASASSRTSQGASPALPSAGARRTGTQPFDTARARSGTAAPPVGQTRGASAPAESVRRSRAEIAEPRTPVKPLPGGEKKSAFTIHQGFDFDRRIDVIGLVLVGFALVAFFSVFPSISFGLLPEPSGGLTGQLNHLLGQLFGWGKLACPPIAFGLGLWLMARSFEQTGFAINIARVLGGAMLYACVLAWLHMLFLLDDVAPTVEAFRPISYRLAVDQQSGGGWVGHQIYVFLLSQLLDWGTASVLLAWLIMSLMLAFDVTIAELWGFVARVFAFIRLSPEEREQRRQARRLARAPSVEVTRPGAVSSPVATTVTAGAAVPGAAATEAAKTAAPAAEASRPQPRIGRRGPLTAEDAPTREVPAENRERLAPVTPPARKGEDELSPRPPARRPLPHMRDSALAGEEEPPISEPTKSSPFASTPAPARPDALSAPQRRPLESLRRSEQEGEKSTPPGPEAVAGQSGRPAPFARSVPDTEGDDRLPELPLPGKPQTRTLAPAADPGKRAEESTEQPASGGGRLDRLLRRRKPDEQPDATAESARPVDSGPPGESTAAPRRRGLFGRSQITKDTTEPAEAVGGATEPDESAGRRPGLLGRGLFRRAVPDRDEDKPPDTAPAPATSGEVSTPPPDSERKPGLFGRVTRDAAPEDAPPAAPGDSPAPAGPERKPGLFGRVTRDAAPEGAVPAAPGDSPAPALAGPERKPGLFGHATRDAAEDAAPIAPGDSPAPAGPERSRRLFGQAIQHEDAPQGPDRPIDTPPPVREERGRPSLGDVAGGVVAGAIGAAAPGNARVTLPQPDTASPVSPSSEAKRGAGLSVPAEGAPRGIAPAAGAPLEARPREAAPDDHPAEPESTRPATPDTEHMARPAHPELLRLRGTLPGARPVTVPGSKPVSPPTGNPSAKADATESPATAPSTSPDVTSTRAATPLLDGVLEPPPEPAATKKAAPLQESAPRPTPPVQKPAAEVASRPNPTPGGRAVPPPATRVPPPAPAARRISEPAVVTGTGDSSPEPRTVSPLRRQISYELPDFRKLLKRGEEKRVNDDVLLEKARIIEETLASFSAPGKVVEVNPGPVITQFGVEPDYLLTRSGKKQRVKVGSIARLDADLALALAAKSIRIEAPVPGKSMVGIEVPNDEVALVSLLDIMEAPEFTRIDSRLRIALGLAVDGTPVAADLTTMPHLLIAGTTGSGKSVCVNAIIACLLLQNTPDDVQFIMVDPKRVELTGYNGIPHLVAPVVVDLERIVGVLQWVQREMETRYHKFAAIGARNILDYNKKIGPDQRRMPYYVVVIDELADLMMLAPDETERLLARLAQMARATGIHLIISTQRPSVDIITGLIKANFPARIAFMVASSVDSRVILDQPGAEKLLGRGDMLFQSPDAAAPVRMQGVFVSDEEIARITSFWKAQLIQKGGPAVLAAANREIAFGASDGRASLPTRRRSSQPTAQQTLWDDPDLAGEGGIGEDELYDQAVELVRSLKKASISLLQRQLRIGYTRAARLIDRMEEDGIIGPPQEGSKPREVIKFD